MTPSRLALAAFFTVALTSYAQATTIYDADNTTLFYPEFVRNAISDGTMAIEIYGSPFATHSKNEAAMIASELKMPPGYGSARFTTTPKPDHAKQRLVMVFNPLRSSGGNNKICKDPKTIGLGTADDPMRVQMALCDSDHWISEATIAGPRGAGIKDPQFVSTLEDGLRELMPAPTQVFPDETS
jgi:hypothetical protein